MSHKNINITDKLSSGVRIPYSRSKEEVWDDLSDRIERGESVRIVPLFNGWKALAVAASVVILASMISFLRFYSKTYSCPPANHITVNLPDGSMINMNASSRLSYHPYWWRFSRDLDFEGEAFFTVQKGNRFRVRSNEGVTEVVGTSFNIFSRSEDYRVTCMSGHVRVSSVRTDVEALLQPFEEARIDRLGDFEIVLVSDKQTEPAWMSRHLKFTSTNLREVLDEIERQFNVKIELTGKTNYIYTGNFSYNTDIESILSLICKPLDLEFIKNAEAEYIIKPDIEN